jgi:hypothetical protein
MSIASDAILHMILRTDDNGRTFLVRDRLSVGDAETAANGMAARGHKQDYRVIPYPESDRLGVLLRNSVAE